MQRKKEKYFTTGEFARFFGIKKDTLFYYDRIGLFSPELVQDNGYRYYSDAQIIPFGTLLSLREMGVPVRELQAYFGSPSPESLLLLAEDKIGKLEGEIRRLREIRQLFGRIAENTREAREAVTGQVEIRQFPDRWMLYSEPLELNSETATGKQWGDAYDRFARQIGTAQTVSFGCVLARRDLEAGNYAKVDRLFMPCRPGEGERLPAGRYAVLYYQGRYSEMQAGYQKLCRRIRSLGLKLDGDAREEYLVADLATKKEEEFITKISVKVR